MPFNCIIANQSETVGERPKLFSRIGQEVAKAVIILRMFVKCYLPSRFWNFRADPNAEWLRFRVEKRRLCQTWIDGFVHVTGWV